MSVHAPEAGNGEHIDVVLHAEREAEEAVERARAEAQAMVASARDAARRIRERTDRRVAAVHAGADAATARRIEALRADEAERREALSRRGHYADALAVAVERVADFLLGSGR